MPAHVIRQASWEACRKQILNNRNLSPEAKHAELEGLGPAPEPPLTPLLTCPEPTFEGLCLLLQGGHPSIGVFSAEGGQFLGGYGMSKDHRLKTAAALSGLWDGEPIRRVRRGDGVILLPGRRVAMHLLVQPGVSHLLLGSRELKDQGLVSRVLATRRRPPRARDSGVSPGPRATWPSGAMAPASCRSSSAPCRLSATSAMSWRRARWLAPRLGNA